MDRIWKISAVFSFLLFGLVVSAFAEDITITTYYPAPFGSYQQLTVSDKQAVGDVNGDSQVDVNDMSTDSGGLTVARSIAIATVDPQGNNLYVNGKAAINGELTVSQSNQVYVLGGGGQDIGWNTSISPTVLVGSGEINNLRVGNGKFMCPAGKYVCGVNNVYNDCDGSTGNCFTVVPICCN